MVTSTGQHVVAGDNLSGLPYIGERSIMRPLAAKRISSTLESPRVVLLA
jgi:hypothetical protein